MSRESKVFTVKNKKEAKQKIYQYESFGWELHSINKETVSMTRETQNVKIEQLKEYEMQYSTLIHQRQELDFPEPLPKFEPILFIFLLICLILPGLGYIVYKYYAKKKYIKRYNAVSSEYNELTEEIKIVCLTSRELFFSINEL